MSGSATFGEYLVFICPRGRRARIILFGRQSFQLGVDSWGRFCHHFVHARSAQWSWLGFVAVSHATVSTPDEVNLCFLSGS
jgi:hypothetical protein